VTTHFINDENMKNCRHNYIKIGNCIVKGVNNRRSEISLIMEDLYAHLLSQILEMFELKLQSTVLVTAFLSSSRRIKKKRTSHFPSVMTVLNMFFSFLVN